MGKKSDKILIAEGFATAATLHECTGLQCFVAFDAGNLTPVARVVRSKRPLADIVICGDSDISFKGQEAANNAALAVNGLVALPPKLGMDFNDYARAGLNHG